jgi:UDP-N-acetylglucosamine:LPS N-acetylglucosamine transferase
LPVQSTNLNKIAELEVKKRIFVAVLNWGLGHATRSVPLIKELQLQGAEPIIGSDGEAADFLKGFFPELQYVEMPSYKVRYENNDMYLNMAKQLPSLLWTLQKERSFIRQIIEKYKIQGIISDNRYAVSSNEIPSVFLGHQLNIRISNFFVSKLINYLNHQFLSKFGKIWVPDFEDDNNLSAELSSGFKHNALSFIGSLSRLNTEVSSNTTYKIVAVLSGPEPQRTYFEDILTSKLRALDIPSLLVRGIVKTGADKKIGQLSIKNFANEEELASLIKGAELYIARSGYSTLMDLAKIGSGALLLVPTPGQTEQEYLANRLRIKNSALVQQQHKLDIQLAWDCRKTVFGLHKTDNQGLLSNAVRDFLESIK